MPHSSYHFILHAFVEDRLNNLHQVVCAFDAKRQWMRITVTVDYHNWRGGEFRN